MLTPISRVAFSRLSIRAPAIAQTRLYATQPHKSDNEMAEQFGETMKQAAGAFKACTANFVTDIHSTYLCDAV